MEFNDQNNFLENMITDVIHINENYQRLYSALRIKSCKFDELSHFFSQISPQEIELILSVFIAEGLVKFSENTRCYELVVDRGYINFSKNQYAGDIEIRNELTIQEVAKCHKHGTGFWESSKYFSETAFFTNEQIKNIYNKIKDLTLYIKSCSKENHGKSLKNLIYKRIKLYIMSIDNNNERRHQ